MSRPTVGGLYYGAGAEVEYLREIRDLLMAIKYAVTKEERTNELIADLAREIAGLRGQVAELQKK